MLTPSPKNPSPPPPNPPKDEDWMEHRILVVDDEQSIRKQLETELKLAGFKVDIAASGEEGLAVLDKAPIRLILSDQKMPGMLGTDFLAEAKRRYPDTVTMVLSAYSESDQIMRAVNQAGAFYYLVKPWNREDLILRIANGLQLYHAQAEQRRLAQANERLLKKMATMQNFSLIGNFSYAMYEQFFIVIQEKLLEMKRKAKLVTADSYDGSSTIMAHQDWLRLSVVLTRLGQLGKLHQLPSSWQQDSVVSLVQSAVDEAKVAAAKEGHQVRFELTCEDSLPRLFLQKDIFSFALYALIENAVIFNKRSPMEGPKRVFVDVKRVRKPDDMITIEVADDGPGTLLEEKIFTPLYSTYPKEASSEQVLGRLGTYNFSIYHHTGLGLPIARWCIARHDGSVYRQREHKYPGAAFRIEIPVEQTDVISQISK